MRQVTGQRRQLIVDALLTCSASQPRRQVRRLGVPSDTRDESAPVGSFSVVLFALSPLLLFQCRESLPALFFERAGVALHLREFARTFFRIVLLLSPSGASGVIWLV